MRYEKEQCHESFLISGLHGKPEESSTGHTLTSFYGGDMDKFYGYGIVDGDGEIATGLVFKDESMAAGLCESKQVVHNLPYRTVELFYKDEQS